MPSSATSTARAHPPPPGLLVVQDIGLEGIAHLLAKAVKLLALHLVELLGKDLGSAHDRKEVVGRIGAGIAVDAGGNEGDGDRSDDDGHHPALVITETLKHGSLKT